MKKIRHIISTLCCSLIALLGFSGCKTTKQESTQPSAAQQLKQKLLEPDNISNAIDADAQATQDLIRKAEQRRKEIEARPVVYGPPPVPPKR